MTRNRKIATCLFALALAVLAFTASVEIYYGYYRAAVAPAVGSIWLIAAIAKELKWK